MEVELLRKYKRENASHSIIKRGKNISLDQANKKSKTHYQFYHQGSHQEPYTIEVFQNIKTIVTTCTCPYDWGGICKHQVAAIDYILELLSTPHKIEKDLFGNKIKREKTEIDNRGHLVNKGIFLEDHQVSEAILKWIINNSQRKNGFIQQDYFEITSAATTKITTKYHSWPTAQQSFNYNPEENNLKTECSCSVSKFKFCSHIAPALSAIVEIFGANVFNPNYLEAAINDFLSQYGMDRNDDYQKYFDFSMGINGLQVTEKIKNIVPSIATAKEELLPPLDEQTEDSLYLKEKKHSPAGTHGIGFCFEFSGYENNNFKLIPFKAKYKKRSKEFLSSFKEIDEYNLIAQFKDLSPQDKNSIIAALEFEETNNKFLRTFTVETLQEANLAFRNFLSVAQDYPFFQKEQRKTLTRKNTNKVWIAKETPELSFKLSKNKDFYSLKPFVEMGERKYQINSNKFDLFPLFCKMQDQLYLFKDPYPFIYINRFNGRSELNFQKKEAPKLYKEVIEPLSEHFKIETTVYKSSQEESPDETLLKKQVFLSDYEGEYIIFKPGVQYGEKLILLHSKAPLFDEQSQKIKKRNDAFENNFLEDFRDLHPDFEQQSPPFFLSPQQLIEDEWLLNTSEKLKQQSVEIFGANNLKSFKYNLHKPTLSMGVASNLDWFDLEIEVKFGKERVSLKEVRKAILKKSRYVQLKDGSLGILPKEWLNKFSKYFKAGEVKNDSIKISNYQFNIIDELHQELETTPQFLMELQQKKKRLQNLETKISVQPPKNVKASLRPYQQDGLNWLVFLDENKLGGCLADDMGLGKTLQTIAFMSYLKKQKKCKKPHLVIAPTSLIFNWQKELEKFCPSLKALVYVGSKRKQSFDSFSKYDLVISTYGSLLNDIEFLKDFPFNYVILDESQAIKNPNSKRYKAVRLLQCENRLALTGTPIENNTFDLYAQMNFLNPGLLGSMSHFRKEFSEAIDKEKNEDASNLLGQMIFPFLLRRTKEQVATELPEKTETVLYCEMGAEQRKIYESFKNKFRDYLLNKIDENGTEKSQIYILEGLTKLRQICNSPELLSDEEDYGKASIKLDILIDHIKSKTAKHKILVFSQFTSMLKLVEERLKEEDLAYEYLDGRTKNREEKVNNFQEDNEIRVFLISLKAGGTGLNLTAADYVFLIDPWWNPAVESQAIDRCYRIGQTNHVMAYKMICRDTVEEKIIDLQQNKKQVSSSIISTDTGKKSFDAKQIKELFG